MRARERVLRAYGGTCAYCGRTDGALEIDHVHGGGNTHRRTIGTKLEYWLCREYDRTGYWPAGFQLLCTPCHDARSGRTPSMSVGKGKHQHNVLLSDAVSQHLVTLAEKPEFHGKKNEVVERAILQLLEGETSDTVLLSVHNHLATLQATMVEALQSIDSQLATVTHTLNTLTVEHRALVARLQRFEEQAERKHHGLLAAYDQLKALMTRKPGRFVGWLSGG
jgi:hypothetical protein